MISSVFPPSREHAESIGAKPAFGGQRLPVAGERRVRPHLGLVHLRPLAARALALLLDAPLHGRRGDQEAAGGEQGDESERQVPAPVGRILLQQERRLALRRQRQLAHVLGNCARDTLEQRLHRTP